MTLSLPVEMLLKCYKTIQRCYETPKSAMSALVQWVAYRASVKSYVDVATPTLTLDVLDDLYDIFDLELLRNDPWDHLGDLAHYLNLKDWLGPYSSKEDTIRWAEKNLPIKHLSKGKTIFFDPRAGTGRLCLALYNLGVDCPMAAIEPAIKPYRLLVINQKLYDLPVFALRSKQKAPFDGIHWFKSNIYPPCHLRRMKKPATSEKEED